MPSVDAAWLAETDVGRAITIHDDAIGIAFTPVHNAPLTFRGKGGAQESIKLDPRLTTNDAQAMYRLARAGAGLAVVPEFLLGDDVAAGRVEYVLPDWEPGSIPRMPSGRRMRPGTY